MSFTLHPRLAAGSVELGCVHGCRVLLKNNALFPWLILVPEVAEGIEDMHQLESARYAEVMQAVREVSEFVAGHFHPDKLNVACIGNQVRQMHIHVVGRSESDIAWPGVVWSCAEKRAYADAEIAAIGKAWRDRG